MGIGTRFIHEGDHFTASTEHGASELKPFFTAKSTMEITADEYENMSQADVLDRLSQVADDLMAQRDRHIIRTIDETVEKTGNVFDIKGDPDKLIDALSAMEFSFDNGMPELSIILHPSSREKAEKMMDRIQSDPRLRKRMDALMDSKRQEWNDREALRKLVG